MRPTPVSTRERDGWFSGNTHLQAAQGAQEFDDQGTQPDLYYQLAITELHLENIVGQLERSYESPLFPINKSGAHPPSLQDQVDQQEHTEQQT